MAEFLLELYVASDAAASVRDGAEAARAAAAEVTREGAPVRCLRAIFVPDEETCFYLFEAPSAEAVREAAIRAALPVERLAAAISYPVSRSTS